MIPPERFATIDMLFPASAAGMVAVAAGLLWSNARRPLNVIASMMLAFVATYFVLFYLVAHPAFGRSPHFWLQGTYSLTPWSLVVAWMVKRASISPATFYRDIIPKAGPLILVVVAMSCWGLTQNVIPTLVGPENTSNGPGYLPFNAIIAALALGILAQTLRELRGIQGIRRLELKILVVGSTVTIVSAASAGVLGRLYQNPWLIRAAPLCALTFVGVMIWGVTQPRILDARQMLLTVLWYGGLLAASVLLLVAATRVGQVPIEFSVGAAAVASFAVIIIGQRWLQSALYGRQRAKDMVARREMLALTRLLEPDLVVQQAEAILSSWAPAEGVEIMEVRGSGPSAYRGMATIPEDVLSSLVGQSGWATPASLQRRHDTRESRLLSEFLRARSFGLVAASSAPLDELPIVVGISERRSHRPYTFVDAKVLSDCSAILGIALSRANLSVKVRQSERLAMSGLINAGFAHEIRTALHTIKAFSEVVESGMATPDELRSLAGTSSEQVARTERMISQILMLVHPKNLRRELSDANQSARRSVAAVACRAAKAGVTVVMKLSPKPQVVLADNALDHCVINLLENAIDALEQRDRIDRRIEVSTGGGDGQVGILVVDNGPGISPQMRDRLFQPFATGRPGGTGLGLMFSKKIVESLNGTLTVESSDHRGTTFAVRLPIPAPISEEMADAV